jgi:hypothetical protein
MAEEWLTYGEVGERLGISSDAARHKAIRARWPRRTADDGRTLVRVDINATRAVMPVRRAPDATPIDARPTAEPTPVEPSDVRAFAALDALIETLRALAAAGELALARERERADPERIRAEQERAQAEAARTPADDLARRLEEAEERMAHRANLEKQLTLLKAQIAEMQAARTRPWWRRLAARPSPHE